MIEWFLELPLVYQIASVILVLMLIGVAGLLANMRGNVVEAGDLPVSGEDNAEEDFSEDEEEPVVGKLYTLTESPYPGQVIVEEIDGTDITGELIIDLPEGARLLNLNRAYSDDYEEYLADHFVLVYIHNGLYRTQTWDGGLLWEDYNVYPSEITVRDNSVSELTNT